jgi:hypothetical protein
MFCSRVYLWLRLQKILEVLIHPLLGVRVPFKVQLLLRIQSNASKHLIDLSEERLSASVLERYKLL